MAINNYDNEIEKQHHPENFMSYFEIIIKSHGEAPDYEDECQANTIEEACEIFAERIAKSSGEDHWDVEGLKTHVRKVNSK